MPPTFWTEYTDTMQELSVKDTVCVCSLIIHELQLSSVSSTTLIFISTHTEQ